ncbi:outer membrane transport energization protein ExbD [Geothermobacter ehrlichii]|uniref:Outer membrane transport energization protein ExbD n=1 Tax=Geothermobacter ehrlichii TaxID=213224 RepID=A0A5D3WKZ2_9BACT|nr:biopolymer transporter ExbD [Geothermobacter ehrlichii]TYO99697.1 outer membrane transport energization protein ExbD [Geothermobacter ehrlichii]
MLIRRRSEEEPRVDLTPMVDVVFLLLIFFMISTTFVETPGIDIKLPESSLTVSEKKPDEVQVYIDRDGNLFFQGKKTGIGQLRKKLARSMAGNRKATFVLMADKEVRHGLVVEVMDVARSAGFYNMAIATESRRGTDRQE